MDFSKALRGLKAGDRIARPTWPKGRYIYLNETLNDQGERKSAYIGFHNPEIPGVSGWMPLPGDILAEDWEAVEAASPAAQPAKRAAR